MSLPAFVNQLEQANLAIAPHYKKLISVNKENFDTAFTEFEEQQVAPFLESNTTQSLPQK